jgi:hypothetical protein
VVQSVRHPRFQVIKALRPSAPSVLDDIFDSQPLGSMNANVIRHIGARRLAVVVLDRVSSEANALSNRCRVGKDL